MESMFLRQKYNYSKELKRPITFGNVDMNKAVENGAMLKCAGFMRKQTEKELSFLLLHRKRRKKNIRQ